MTRPLAPPIRIPNVEPEVVNAPGLLGEPKLVGNVSDAPPYSSTVISGPTAQIAEAELKVELTVRSPSNDNDPKLKLPEPLHTTSSPCCSTLSVKVPGTEVGVGVGVLVGVAVGVGVGGISMLRTTLIGEPETKTAKDG